MPVSVRVRVAGSGSASRSACGLPGPIALVTGRGVGHDHRQSVGTGLNLWPLRWQRAVVVPVQSYVERPPVPALGDLVRVVWIQRIGAQPYLQRNLPTGGVGLYCAIGSLPRLTGPLTGPSVEVLAPGTTVIGVRVPSRRRGAAAGAARLRAGGPDTGPGRDLGPRRRRCRCYADIGIAPATPSTSTRTSRPAGSRTCKGTAINAGRTPPRRSEQNIPVDARAIAPAGRRCGRSRCPCASTGSSRH